MEFVEVIRIHHTKRQQHPKKAKVTFYYFLPTVLHDHAASRLVKRTMDMSFLIYQCLQTDAKIVKTVDKLDVNWARENIFGGLSRNVWKEEWRTNWKAILAKDIQEEFILIFTYFLSVVDFMFFSSKLNHVILIWGSCLSHCPYLKKSVFNDDSNWCWEIRHS